MKRKHMNSVARSLCDFLMSRNKDIIGYWGIGFICRVAVKERKNKFSFKVYPGQPIKIYGYELTNSLEITGKLVKHEILTGSCHYLCGQLYERLLFVAFVLSEFGNISADRIRRSHLNLLRDPDVGSTGLLLQ